MNRIPRFCRAAGLTAFFLFALQGGQAQNPVAPEGVEVQARGPVHEAYAQPMSQRQDAGPIIAKQPPAPITELPPDQKPEGEQVIWIPGYWAWDDDRMDYLWVSGIWRAPPPGLRWVPGYWQQVQGGWRWVTGYWGPADTNAVSLYAPPPDPIAAAIPPAPNQDSTYAPGIWVFAQNQYQWRPGIWVGNRPGWIWIPASYCWTPGGYVFVNGYWDHDFDHRGLCFAPVFLDARIYRRPGWTYRPAFVLAADFLLDCLFVHAGSNHYFFGDYYDPAYARRGYTPWMDHRFVKNVPDPLFSYYRWQNRANPRWETTVRQRFTARTAGTLARPARTFALQEQAIAGRKAGVVRGVVPLAEHKGTVYKLAPVTKAHAEEIRKAAPQWNALSQQRGKLEVEAKRPVVVEKKVEPHPPARIELPRAPVRPPAMVRTPPPRPVHPEPKVVPKKK